MEGDGAEILAPILGRADRAGLRPVPVARETVGAGAGRDGCALGDGGHEEAPDAVDADGTAGPWIRRGGRG